MPETRSRIVHRLLPPLAVFLLVRAVLLAASLQVGADTFDKGTWIQWDSHFYLQIARSGHELFPCSVHSRGSKQGWCGNTGWMPGYPYLLRVLAKTGLSLETAAVALSTACAFLVLLLLWVFFLGHDPTPRNLAALTAAGFFPGFVFLHAAFPLSLELVFLLLATACLVRKRFLLAGLAGAAAAFIYTSGALFAVVAAGWLTIRLLKGELSFPAWVRGLLLASGLTVAGLGLVFVIHWQTTDHWDALFKIQSQYVQGVHNPFSTFLRKISRVFRWPYRFKTGISWQTLLVAVFSLWCLVRQAARPGEITDRNAALLLYLLAYWLSPLFAGPGLNIYRSEVLLLPAVALLGGGRVQVTAAFAAGFLAIGYSLCVVFFRGLLL
ncbi:hypothetical protein ACFL4G_13380 [Thermodesulfobacteriota bacterium]